jgi:hypothetical protein
VHAYDYRCVDARHVEADVVLSLVPGRFAPISDLKPVLVRSTSADGRGIATERVTQHTNALVVRSLDPQIDGRSVGRTREEDFTAGSLDGCPEIVVNIGPTRDAVHLGV